MPQQIFTLAELEAIHPEDFRNSEGTKQEKQKPAAKPMSPREAVCQYMGWDFAEAGDYRYHYGRTSAPIYSTADGYVCATATGKKPPKYDGLHWKEAAGSNAEYCKIRGKTVWVASGEIEE